MKSWHTQETDELCRALLSLQTMEECYAFLDDVCTIRELKDLSMRLKVAGMLRDKKNYQEIAQETGVSTATISRVRKCMEYGDSGYTTVLNRLEEGKNND